MRLRLFRVLIILVALVMLLPATPRAEAEMVDPANYTPYEDGYITDVSFSRTNSSNELYYGTVGDHRSYIQFNTAPIPDNATILEVYLQFKTGPASDEFDITEIQSKPSNTANSEVYADIGNGTVYKHPNITPGSTQTERLSDEACADLEDLLSAGWFAVGIFNDTAESGYLKSSETSNDPALIIYYSSSGYYYSFNGLFYENGTKTSGSVVATIVSSDGTDQLTVDGNMTRGFTSRPLYVAWSLLGAGYTRILYIITDTGSIYLFTPEATYSIYTFTIRDFTGVLSSGDNYFEVVRWVNATEHMVTREKIIDPINGAVVYLCVGRGYVIYIRDHYGTVHNFGTIVAGSSNPILTLQELGFTQQTQYTAGQVLFEATRSANYGTINGKFNDTLTDYDTTLVEFRVKYRNGTQAYYANSTADNVAFAWSSADAETDYVAYIHADHDFFGELNYAYPLRGNRTYVSFPDLGVIGTFGDLDAGNVLGAIMIVAVAALFSATSVIVGGFAMIIVAGILTELGVVDIPYTVLALAMSLLVILGFSLRGEHR